MTRCCACSLALLVSLAWTPLPAQEGALFQAMRDELRRSMEELRLGEMQGPYFLAYRVTEDASVRAVASLGSVISSRASAGRLLSVEVRVGDASFDNTNFYSRSGSAAGRFPTSLPLADDYAELRRRIWLATDAAYKRALDHLSRKRAALQNATRVDDSPDFSVEQPHQHADDRAPASPDQERVESLVRDISAVFRGLPHVFVSEVRGEARAARVHYLNSEGFSFVRSAPAASIRVLAGTQADDGTALEDSITAHARYWTDFPDRRELLAWARGLADRLRESREAEVFDRYTGPVLFEGQAAAGIVRRILAPRLLAVKPPVADDARLSSVFGRLANPFVDKLGSRVLPRFLDLVDDPTLDRHAGAALLGGYAVDDDGLPARAKTLVRRGILKTLLAGRNPVQGVAQSTGNRRGFGPAPSNLVLVPEAGLDADGMRRELLSLVQERELEFGIVVRHIGDPPGRISRQSRPPGTSSGSGERSEIGAIAAYKVFPDGREEFIRQAALAGVTESDFRDIVAASSARTVHSASFLGGGGLPSGAVLVGPLPVASFVVPDLLFEDITVRRPRGNIPSVPVVPHPLSSR